MDIYSARPPSSADARAARHHLARARLPRRAGSGIINSARIRGPGRRLAAPGRRRRRDQPGRRLVRRPRARQRAAGRERAAAPAARRGRRRRSRRPRPATRRARPAPAEHRPDIADGDAVTAEVVGGAPATSRARCASRRASSSGIAKDMPVVVGTDGRPRSWARSCAVSANRADRRNASTTRNFGVGAQLDADGRRGGPKGIAEGQRDSSLLRFSVIDNSSTGERAEEGRRRDHAGRRRTTYPRGLVIGTVVRSVDAGGAVAPRRRPAPGRRPRRAHRRQGAQVPPVPIP